MSTYADRLIDALGGTTEVAELVKAPTSTVHSWRRKGLSPSRLDHLKLAAAAAGKTVDWDDPRPPLRQDVAA